MNRKSQLAFMLSFLIAAVTVITLSAVMNPAINQLNDDAFDFGQGILNQTQEEDVPLIQTTYLRNNINTSINEAVSATSTNKRIISEINNWAWFIVIALIAITIYIFTRQVIEIQERFGFV